MIFNIENTIPKLQISNPSLIDGQIITIACIDCDNVFCWPISYNEVKCPTCSNVDDFFNISSFYTKANHADSSNLNHRLDK